MAFAKHFPGHGDTKVDSHLELPVINHSREHLDSVELLPFRRLVEDGVGGVMVGHLQVNAYDRERPSSLSPVIINGLLRNTLGFKGIVITDGIDMKGITNTYKDGTAELAALRAGNDFILLPPDVKQAIDVIASAAKQDEELRHLINYHCRRVLHTKYHYVLPTLGDEITVPGSDNRRVCQDIVADLNINLDRTIDSIVDDAISKHAIPGCQIVVMHRGKPILDRCYGHLTYDSAAANVTPTTLYDLASLTKVNATTLAVMKLADNGKVKIDDKLSRYLPYLKNTDKADITIKQAMSHCARLKAFDAYWKRGHDYDSILRLVAASPLNDKPGMLYSDLGFMLLSDLVKRVSGKPLDVFVREQFYQPMGLTNTTFRPMNHGVASKFIAPTEVDSLRGLICGEVHDPNAYAMGGVVASAAMQGSSPLPKRWRLSCRCSSMVAATTASSTSRPKPLRSSPVAILPPTATDVPSDSTSNSSNPPKADRWPPKPHRTPSVTPALQEPCAGSTPTTTLSMSSSPTVCTPPPPPTSSPR